MDQFDIKEVLIILKQAKKLDDWDGVDDAIEYLSEFYEGGNSNNEDE